MMQAGLEKRRRRPSRRGSKAWEGTTTAQVVRAGEISAASSGGFSPEWEWTPPIVERDERSGALHARAAREPHISASTRPRPCEGLAPSGIHGRAFGPRPEAKRRSA